MIRGGYQRDAKAGGKSAGKAARKAGGKPAGGPRRAAPVYKSPVPSSAAEDSELAAPPPPRVGWQTAVTSTVKGLGYELVDIERAQRGLLRVTIDRIPGRVYSVGGGLAAADAAAEAVDSAAFVTVEDCEKVTRQLQYALEVEGLDYARLEVSSPGLDRPLKQPADYERFAGQAVQVVLKQAFQGRKNWQGVLTPVPDAPVDKAGDAAATSAADLAPRAWSLVFKDGKTEQVLGFTLEEVREARLVPVVNFKGRKAADGNSLGTTAAQPAAAPGQDGG